MKRYEYDESLCPHDSLISETINGQRSGDYFAKNVEGVTLAKMKPMQ